MIQLMGFGIPLQEGDAEEELEQGLMHELALRRGLRAHQSPPGSADPYCGYYLLHWRTKELCSAQSPVAHPWDAELS